jgi:hypothetical protein
MVRRRKMKVLVGPRVGVNATTKLISYSLFLPGLVLNLSPDRKRAEELYNITHRHSGTAVVRYVPLGAIERVKEVLGKANWVKKSSHIYGSKQHVALAMEADTAVTRYHHTQEKRLAKRLNGKVQPGSGNQWGHRRDVISKEHLAEAKWTDSNSFSLDLKDWKYLCKQARLQGRIPLYALEYRAHDIEVFVVEVYDLYETIPTDRMRSATTVPGYQNSIAIGLAVAKAADSDNASLFTWGDHNILVINAYRLLAATRAL